MALEAQTLFEEAKCYACFGPLSDSQLLTLAMERRWLLSLNPAADVTPQGLITYSQCYACYGASTYDLLELALLDQIAQLS